MEVEIILNDHDKKTNKSFSKLYINSYSQNDKVWITINKNDDEKDILVSVEELKTALRKIITK